MKKAPRSPLLTTLRQQLRLALALVFGFAMAIALLGVVLFTYHSERTYWLDRQVVEAELGVHYVSSFLEQVGSWLQQIERYGLDELNANSGSLGDLLEENPALLEAALLDPAGEVLYLAARGEAHLSGFTAPSQSTWFKHASRGEVYVTNLNIDASDRAYVILAVPGSAGGVNAALIDLRLLWEAAGQGRRSQTGQVMVVNQAGQLIANSDPGVELASKHILSNPQYAALLENSQVSWRGESRSLDGQPVISAAAPVGGTGWLVIAEVLQSEAFTNTRRALVTLSLVLALTGVIGFYFILLFLDRLILKPVFRLQRGAELVGQGQLAVRLQPDRLDELGQVMLSFNDMVDSLQSQRQELNQRASSMESLYQVGLSLISQRGLKAVLDRVIAAVFQQIPSAYDVHLFSYEDEKLIFHASRYADGRVDVLAKPPTPEGATYTAVRYGRIVEIAQENLMDEQGNYSLPGSLICMPLKIGMQVVGVMNLALIPPRRLENHELRGLQLLCDQAAIAIHTAHLDEQARHELVERRAAEDELRYLNAHLEQRIAQRTQELWLANEELRREADERQEAMQRLSSSLEEKEILLREIHHRVKNNLQVISSMFNLQVGRLSDPQMVEVLRESQNRLRSMGLIHEKLYRSEDLSQVDFSGYIESLAAFLFQAYRFEPQQVQLHLDVEAVDLPIDTAVPCGLLLNELIANSLKHAFPAGRRGNLYVELKRLSGENILLRVADDGIGLPVTADLSTGPSLGMTLVRALAEQLDGSLEVKRETGVEFCLTFPVSAVSAAEAGAAPGR